MRKSVRIIFHWINCQFVSIITFLPPSHFLLYRLRQHTSIFLHLFTFFPVFLPQFSLYTSIVIFFFSPYSLHIFFYFSISVLLSHFSLSSYSPQMPPIATTILPHPKSLNNITLLNLMKETAGTSVAKFLCTDIR